MIKLSGEEKYKYGIQKIQKSNTTSNKKVNVNSKKIGNGKKNLNPKFNLNSNSNCAEIFSSSQKLTIQLLKVLKMRLSIEHVYHPDEYLINIIKENIKLVDVKNIEIKTINNFVDDLIEIITCKSLQNESMSKNINMLTVSSINKSNNDDVNKLTGSTNIYRSVNTFNKEIYQPRATSQEAFHRRRTIELGRFIYIHHISA
jgi:hypothetical protein